MVATDLIDGRQNANQNSALEYSFLLAEGVLSFGSHGLDATAVDQRHNAQTNGKLRLACPVGRNGRCE